LHLRCPIFQIPTTERGMFLDSRRVTIHADEERDAEGLLASSEQCSADDNFSRKVEACWTRRPAAIASLLLSVGVLTGIGVGFRLRGQHGNLRQPAYASLYKFGQAADLSHYEKAIEGICSKNAQHDHSQAVPITKPMVLPRANLCTSKLLSDDFPCGFTRNWSCPSFPPAVKANATGVAANDGSLGYHCCCEIERLRSVTWSRHPFKDDADSMPEPQKVRIKVVTYNIFWWNLFGIHKGNGGTAGGVVATSNVREPIDLIAFQECRDKDRVLDDAGLLNSFHTFAGMYEKCIALNKEAWIWLEEGEEDVATDVYWNNFGPRGVIWARVMHRASGLRVFFANHHGPLAVNSGGQCGGFRTARNLLRVIHERSESGDIVILAGDFNANPASHTIQELRKSLIHVHAGTVLGGIDNVFTNLKPSSVVSREDLGSGGSDHHALATIFEVDTGGYQHPAVPSQDAGYSEEILGGLRKGFPGDDWGEFWCGLEHTDVSYNPVGGSGRIFDSKKVSTPDWCCRYCQRSSSCKAFRFEGIPGSNTTRCTFLTDYEPGLKDANYSFVASGLAAEWAIQSVERSFRADTCVAVL